MSPRLAERGRPAPAALGVAGALLFLALSWSAAATKSATFDEGVHLLSGYRILTEDDFRFNHEHPPLMKILAALPLVAAGTAAPLEPWRYTSEADHWPLAHSWLYHANDGDRLLRQGRLAVALTGALLGLAVFLAARSATAAGGPPARRGRIAGILMQAAVPAVLLFALEPNLLAHGSLVTTDMGMAVFFFAGAAAWWRFLETRSLLWMILAGVLWGLDMAAKFTGVILGPVYLLMGAAWLLWPGRDGTGTEAAGPGRGMLSKRFLWGLDRPAGRWLHLGSSLAAVSLTALLVLDATYGFEGLFTSLGSMHLESATFQELALGPLGGIPLPVPAPFVWGFDHAESGGSRWWSYLMGEFSQEGFRHYYLVALAVKTSIPLLLLALAGLSLGGRAGARARTRWVFLALPPLALLAAFTFTDNVKNIGLRYVLPVYPFLCVLGGLGVAALLRRPGRWGPAAAALLVVWAAGAEASVYPHHLAYFNVAAGGPEGGRRWLLDSNLDWGQDLKGLGQWMREHEVPSIWLDYFGRGCPVYEGVRTRKDFQGGWIAVSATNLYNVYRPGERDRYRFLMEAAPEASIGHSILVYNVPRPPGWRPRPGTPFL